MTGRQIEKDNRLVRYLLGELTDEEQAKLEDAYFSDDSLYHEMQAVETELIDAYVRGQISGEIRTRFEERYLASPHQRERIEFARLLYEKARVAPLAATQERTRLWDRIWPPLNLPGRLLAPGAALLVLAVVIAGSLWLYRQNRPEPSQARQAAPAKSRPAEAPARIEESSGSVPGNNVIALLLSPGLTRGEGPGNVLRVPPSANLVRLEIGYDGETYQSYRVLLRTPEGREVWRQSSLKPLQPGTKTVVVTFPANTLGAGDYIVTLSGFTSAGTHEDLADYSFRVATK